MIDVNASNDLISRTELLNDLSYCAPELWQDEQYIKAKIMKQPAVDAKPVRHGRWSKKTCWQPISYTATKDFPFYECTQCGWNRRFANEYHYCPSCGAEMDGKPNG